MTILRTAWTVPRDAQVRPAVRRRRGGRRGAVLLTLLLAGGWWWTTHDDARTDLSAAGDPATYRALVGRVATWLDGVALVEEVSAADPAAVSAPRGGALAPLRQAPPVGVGESESRLAPGVIVPGSDPAHRFAALQDDGVSPVAWSPCRPIHYVINASGAPEGFAARVETAMAQLSAVTGLVLVNDGATDEEPAQDRGPYLPDRYGDRWAPVLISVADPQGIPFLEGETAGVAYTYRVRGLESGLWHLVSGSVYLDREAFEFRSDVHGEPGWMTVLRHELGHLVGLDHLEDSTQLMNPVTSRDVHTYQAGDLTGLARLGRGECAPDA